MTKQRVSVEKVIQQAMPGWKIVKSPPLADKISSMAANTQADAISPGLAAQQAKRGVVGRAVVKKVETQRTTHAQFVTVTPKSQPDAIGKFHKVLLVKGGKIIAQQG